MRRQEMSREWYFSPYSGMFSEHGLVPRQAHDPDVSVWSGSAPLPDPLSAPPATGGAGWDDESAQAAGIGEAIERLQAWPLPCDGVIESALGDWPLDETAMGPEHWVLFHPEQYALDGFPYQPVTESSVCRWVCLREALTGEPRWVPEELVFLSLPRGRQARFCPMISSGLSCGRAGHPVLLRGLQEAIERDAVVGASWGRYPLTEHNAQNVFANLGEEYATRLRRPNLQYRFFRVGTPYSNNVTIVTLEGDDREGYCYSVGAACRETRQASWLKSILEAVQGRRYVRHLKRQYRQKPWPLEVPASFADHALYYSIYPGRLRETALGRASGTKSEAVIDVMAQQAEDLLQLSARLGPERPVLFRNLTPPALAAERMGWCVLRVVVPGLQPLHGHHALPFLGGSLWAPRTWNDWFGTPPHPFP